MLTDPGAVPRHATPVPSSSTPAEAAEDGEVGDNMLEEKETSRLTAASEMEAGTIADGLPGANGGGGGGGVESQREPREHVPPAAGGVGDSVKPPVKWCHK